MNDELELVITGQRPTISLERAGANSKEVEVVKACAESRSLPILKPR
jgi:hypothetical protein